MNHIDGFSKLSKSEKLTWISDQISNSETLKKFEISDESIQKTLDELSENTISNFVIPFGIAPNFLINENVFSVPMVIEESSVVAAASKSAKFWAKNGGFKATILGTTKVGHIHFSYEGFYDDLADFFESSRDAILKELSPLSSNMEKRGGGILDVKLIDKSNELEDYYQLEFEFETCDAMGANFINTYLESYAKVFKTKATISPLVEESKLEVNMCILSNYTPKCMVNVQVACPIENFESISQGLKAEDFARRFKRAVDIAKVDVSRAVTHNKGIFNGIDAVVLATGNDFRAIEACGHAYAARSGRYRGLSDCIIENGEFRFEMTIPLALGTVGGLTNLHPLAKTSLDILRQPSARELMKVVACVGLAQNFGALHSLVTTGIQKGHMKMHLLNILAQLGASEYQIEEAKKYFETRVVSYQEVRNFLNIH